MQLSLGGTTSHIVSHSVSRLDCRSRGKVRHWNQIIFQLLTSRHPNIDVLSRLHETLRHSVKSCQLWIVTRNASTYTSLCPRTQMGGLKCNTQSPPLNDELCCYAVARFRVTRDFVQTERNRVRHTYSTHKPVMSWGNLILIPLKFVRKLSGQGL